MKVNLLVCGQNSGNVRGRELFFYSFLNRKRERYIYIFLCPTELASHEVTTGLLGVFAMDGASLLVELGELVSVEAVVVVIEAEGRCAVFHGLELDVVIDSLLHNVIVVDVVS